MGDVYWGLHLPIAAAIRRLGVRVCYETGTYFGGGAAQLAGLFDRVVTVEASPDLAEFCRRAYQDVLSNVEFVHGNSAEALRVMLQREDEAILLVLDAHWFPSGANVAGLESQCPVVQELAAVAECPQFVANGSIIMIDDADMFLRSLPAAFNDSDFPTLFELEATLRRLGFQYVFLCDDVLVAGPGILRELESEYLELRHLGKPSAKSAG